jgi:site-specific recombinase XerC
MTGPTSNALPVEISKRRLFQMLGYTPHPGQVPIHRSTASRRIVACGVRWGKTKCAAMEGLAAALMPRNRSFGWVGTMKGGRRDTVYLNPAILAHLRRYLDERTSGPVFTGRGSERITARHVQRRLAGWLRRAKIATPASPHSFRHAAAMRIYRTTGDLALVQAALCHRSITSTLVYARVDAGRVRAAMG